MDPTGDTGGEVVFQRICEHDEVHDQRYSGSVP
jgi:hypothetical protein